jgi:hypothetical protein
MKITWEYDDLRPGRKLRSEKGVELMIAFDVDTQKLMIVSLEDGMVMCKDQEVAEWLNRREILPQEISK